MTDVKQSLADLGERLRAAHAAMDGARSGELSSEQRSLVDELARAAFDGADLTNPSGGAARGRHRDAAGSGRRPRCRRPARAD